MSGRLAFEAMGGWSNNSINFGLNSVNIFHQKEKIFSLSGVVVVESGVLRCYMSKYWDECGGWGGIFSTKKQNRK